MEKWTLHPPLSHPFLFFSQALKNGSINNNNNNNSISRN